MIVGDQYEIGVRQFIEIKERSGLTARVWVKIGVDVDDLPGQFNDEAVLAEPPKGSSTAAGLRTGDVLEESLVGLRWDHIRNSRRVGRMWRSALLRDRTRLFPKFFEDRRFRNRLQAAVQLFLLLGEGYAGLGSANIGA